jgi:hypothetical protein
MPVWRGQVALAGRILQRDRWFLVTCGGEQERTLEERIAVASSTNAFLAQQLEAARAARAGRPAASARAAAAAEEAAEARRNVLTLKVFRVALEGGGGGAAVWGEAEPTTFLSVEFYASATQ